MKLGKLKESILDRSVFKQIHKRNDNILCKPKVGLGYQTLITGPDTYAWVSVNTVEGTPFQAGSLIVPRGINSLVCSGAEPAGIMVSLTVPQDMEEPEFRKMIQRIEADCEREGIDLAGGHTQVSANVRQVIASVTCLGTAPGQGAGPRTAGGQGAGGDRENMGGQGAGGGRENSGGQGASGGQADTGARADHGSRPMNGAAGGKALAAPLAGQSIIMTKWAGMSGAWLLEQEYHEAFVNKYNHHIAGEIQAMDQYFSVRKEAEAALEQEPCFLYDLSESGVFGGLWEAAQAGHTGLWVDLKQIPIRQEVVELCDFVDINPYKIPSAGALLIGTEHGERLVNTLKRLGIPAAVIGTFTPGNDRVVANEDEARYLEPPSGREFPKKVCS